MSVLALGIDHDTPGRAIVEVTVATTVTYAVIAAGDAAGIVGFEAAATVAALALFAFSMIVWVLAFARALARSTAGDDLAVASMFFLQGSAPRALRVRFLGVVASLLVLTIATLASNPIGFLVNMLPIGLAGLWGARHGTYPERTDPRYTGRTDGRYRQRTHQGRGGR